MADESGTTSSDEVTLESTSVVKTPRRRALWGVLAAVAVAAAASAMKSRVRAGSSQSQSIPA